MAWSCQIDKLLVQDLLIYSIVIQIQTIFLFHQELTVNKILKFNLGYNPVFSKVRHLKG